MRFAIVEERWASGDLRYVRLLRTAEPNRGTQSLIGMFPSDPQPLPADVTYGDREEAERDAELLRLLQLAGERCSYATVMLDGPGLTAMRALATERMKKSG